MLPILLLGLACGIPQEAPAAVEIPVVHRTEGREIARGRITIAGPLVTGEAASEDSTLAATCEVGADGLVQTYRRTVRRKPQGGLMTRVVLQAREQGYTLREEGPLGGRTRDLDIGRVHAVVDAAWPEAIIAPLLQKSEGFLHVLVLASGEQRTVEIRPHATSTSLAAARPSR